MAKATHDMSQQHRQGVRGRVSVSDDKPFPINYSSRKEIEARLEEKRLAKMIDDYGLLDDK